MAARDPRIARPAHKRTHALLRLRLAPKKARRLSMGLIVDYHRNHGPINALRIDVPSGRLFDTASNRRPANASGLDVSITPAPVFHCLHASFRELLSAMVTRWPSASRDHSASTIGSNAIA